MSLWTPSGAVPPPPTSTGVRAAFVDPFAGNQVKMSADLFKQALDVLKAPVGTPGRQGLSDYVFAAAMVVDLREDALASVNGKGRNGSGPPTHFFCPTCDQSMIEDAMNQSILCTKCSRGVSMSLLMRLFIDSPPVAPGGMGVPHINSIPSKGSVGLTASLAPHQEPDPEKLKAKSVEHGKPVEYWRAWQIRLEADPSDEDGFKPYLRSSMDKVPWPAKEPFVADHKGGKCPKGDTPNWHCTCGLYGVKSLIQAQRWANTSGYLQVVGKVAMWGTIHEYTEGARSSHAYPKELWIPAGEHWNRAKNYYDDTQWTAERLQETLAALYGIEVHVDDGLFDLELSKG